MVFELRVAWSGSTVGPGVSVLHGRATSATTDEDAAQTLVERAKTLFNGWIGAVPTSTKWTFPVEVTKINTTTGILEDVIPVEPGPVISGAGGAVAYAAPCGARIDWLTGAVVAGRRLRGRTFVVPLVTAAYETNGTLTAATVSAIKAAGDNYISTGAFAGIQPSVWSRTHGIEADIIGTNVPDEAAVMRSRRD